MSGLRCARSATRRGPVKPTVPNGVDWWPDPCEDDSSGEETGAAFALRAGQDTDRGREASATVSVLCQPPAGPEESTEGCRVVIELERCESRPRCCTAGEHGRRGWRELQGHDGDGLAPGAAQRVREDARHCHAGAWLSLQEPATSVSFSMRSRKKWGAPRSVLGRAVSGMWWPHRN